MTDASKIKVTIKDGAALQEITVQQLKTYIENNGWHKKEDIVRTLANAQRTIVGEVWTQDVGPRAMTALVVPGKETFSDYVARLSEAIMVLEKIEGRTQLEIYVDITKKPVIIKPKKPKKKK